MTTKIIKVRLILEEEKKVLLLEQTNENGGKYTLVGGTVEALEFARKALIRECREEIGIKLKSNDLSIAHILHKKKIGEDRITFYFNTVKWAKTIKCKEKKKFAAVSWFPIDNLPLQTSSTVRHVLEQIKMGKLYSELIVGDKKAYKQRIRDAKAFKNTKKKVAISESLPDATVEQDNLTFPIKIIESKELITIQ